MSLPQPVPMTSPMLKALTHPLRRRIVRLMRSGDPMRATDLAERLDVAANSVSFHLRRLAAAGMIREAPELARDRRDRVWVLTGSSFGLDHPDAPVSAEEEAAIRAFVDQEGLDLQDLLRRVLAWAPEWAAGRDPVARAQLASTTLELTEEEMEAVGEEFREVLARAKDRARAEPQDGRKVWQVVLLSAEEGLGRPDGG
ncbi:ArsR/SmtB family transcription factor [Ornithinimicrobium flavum]|uniref:ArsR/SmtB family transcription factor n=1 Tax=Ornithinimicrobium flavum TaxID=1288636 RepID=UPI00106FF6B6|nr:helix-turn-helix domain-containing protein [Ornithinimicrobium flavum]